jgi:hypothetical protein
MMQKAGAAKQEQQAACRKELHHIEAKVNETRHATGSNTILQQINDKRHAAIIEHSINYQRQAAKPARSGETQETPLAYIASKLLGTPFSQSIQVSLGSIHRCSHPATARIRTARRHKTTKTSPHHCSPPITARTTLALSPASMVSIANVRPSVLVVVQRVPSRPLMNSFKSSAPVSPFWTNVNPSAPDEAISLL